MSKRLQFIKFGIYFSLCLLCFVSCSDDDNSSTEFNTTFLEYIEELNVEYGSSEGQIFDIYLPENRTASTKVIILVHGGGWTEGDKTDMNIIKDLIRQDLPHIAIVNMNYRLADEDNSPYPMQINDITTVVNFLKDHQEEYVISDDIAFLGLSAGAHLSMLYSYAFDTNNDVKFVASVVGPTNFTDPQYLNNQDPIIEEILETYGIEPSIEFLEEVSPYHQVTASAPPTILFYGGQDPLIPTSQGIDLRDKLETLGVTHQFTLYPNSGHGWIGPELIDTWTKLRSFTELHLQ